MPDRTGDDGLVERLRHRDGEAWEAVYLDLYPRLRAFAARRVGEQFVADIVATTMTKAVASIDRFDSSGTGLAAWVFGICRHVVADHHRATARELRRPTPVAESVAGADHTIEFDEEKQAMRRAYGLLSGEDREVLDLRVIAGLTADEVGALLGRKAGAIRMAQSRALDRLRDRFKDEFKEVYR